MSATAAQGANAQEDAARSLLDRLLEESKLYRTSKDYLALLDFTKRLRNFAPFNAMLLHVQKPSLQCAASAFDWADRFGRHPKENARRQDHGGERSTRMPRVQLGKGWSMT